MPPGEENNQIEEGLASSKASVEGNLYVASQPGCDAKGQPASAIEEPPSTEKCGLDCSWRRFNGVKMAQGYAVNNISRGAIVMSNIFLTSSLVFLASKEAGCVDGNDEIVEDCDGKVHGWSPGPLVANIAVISGVLSAFLMPLFGAIMDYTHHRWNVGVATAIFITLIQAVQIYTVSSTWLAMSVLQALAGFLYQIEVLSVYAYLPDMARIVGQSVMTNFQSTFTMIQFSAQSLFLIVVIGIGLALKADDVLTAQVSQAINTVWIAITFVLSWRLLPYVPPSRELPEGRHLWSAGFIQVGQTAARIHRVYSRSLQWYFLAVIFAEASVNAFTVVSVIYLGEHIGMSGQMIGLFFLSTLLATLPGSVLGWKITSLLGPKNSYRLCLVVLTVVAVVGALLLRNGMDYAAFIWGLFIGIVLGWFYPTEGLFFSLCLPKGQDAEFAGFFVYCTQILGWLPPLIFAILVEAGMDQKYGIMSVTVFMLIAVSLLSCLPSWDEVLDDVRKTDEMAMGEGTEACDSTRAFRRGRTHDDVGEGGSFTILDSEKDEC